MAKAKARGNHTGTVYKRKDRNTWEAQIVVGWKPNKDGTKLIAIKKTFGGYKTKKEALAVLNRVLNGEPVEHDNTSLKETFELWKEAYKDRVKEKTFKGYEQAYNHFSALQFRRINTITAAELQACMDKCPAGKRTHQMMKVTAGLIWAYAVDANIVTKDITENLYIGKHQTTTREPLSPKDIEQIKNAIGTLRYAEYIYCLCYLGFRPGEFLEIKKDQVMSEVVNEETVYYIVEGKKTTAGINRKVVIPKQILPYVLERLYIPGTDYLFPFYYFEKNKDCLKELRQMKVNYFEESVFKKITQALGIEGKVPYSARHSYADKLKHADGDVRDKAALIGHSDYSFTRQQYQSSPLEDLKTVTDSLE